MQLQNYNDIEKCFRDIKPKLRCHAKTNGAIPYWNTATIDWFSRIRLRKAKYDNPKPCWHVDIIGEGDSNSVYSGFNI